MIKQCLTTISSMGLNNISVINIVGPDLAFRNPKISAPKTFVVMYTIGEAA